MGEYQAFIEQATEDRADLVVRENCTLYSSGDAILSEQYTLEDDGVDHLFGAQPEQPLVEADRILAKHGWTREGPWAIGDVVTSTHATVIRKEAGASSFNDIAAWVNQHYADGATPDRAELMRVITEAAGRDYEITASAAYAHTHHRTERGEFLRLTAELVADRILERLRHPGSTQPYNSTLLTVTTRGIAGSKVIDACARAAQA